MPGLPCPLSPVFVSHSLPSVSLGQINLHCAENLTLGVHSQYVSSHITLCMATLCVLGDH